MQRRSERIKASQTTAAKVADTDQATGLTLASSRNKIQRKPTSALSSEKPSPRRSTTTTLAAQKNSHQQTKRRKKISSDDKHDSGPVDHSVKVFRGMRGKLRQLTEFPLDILFEVCNQYHLARNLPHTLYVDIRTSSTVRPPSLSQEH